MSDLKEKKQFTEKFVDFIFSTNEKKWILLFVILGFVLRVLSAFRNEFSADEMVHGVHAIGFIGTGKLQIMDQDAIWFFLSDLFMKIFGVNAFGIRFASILFGTLTIIVVYLLGKEVFNKKVGVLASFIFAISSYQLSQMQGLMDITMAFFALFAIYFLVMFFKSNQKIFFILSWASLGIAIMSKQIAILFIPAFILFSLYYNKKYHEKYKFKQIFYAAVIIIVLIVPVLTFNYLLYKDKGIVDLQFARFTKVSFSTYESIGNTITPFSFGRLFISDGNGLPGIIKALNILYNFEVIPVLLLALMGIFLLLSFKNKNRFSFLLIFSFLFPFLFLAGTSLLSNHFVFATAFISLFASLAVFNLKKLFNGRNAKIFFYTLIILIIVFSFIKVYSIPSSQGLFGKNELQSLIEFKEANIGQNSLVVADSRIYRGRIVFMFWDRHYIESNLFPELLQQSEQYPENVASLDIFFIEAVTDDSGWGTIREQPEFNATTEGIVEFAKANFEPLQTINGRLGEPHFNIYKSQINLGPTTLALVDSTHEWFYYPVNYKPQNKIFDNYDAYNLIDSLLDKFAHLILYLEVIIALIFIFILFFLLHKSS